MDEPTMPGSGRVPDDEELERRLRAALVRPVPPQVAARHLRAMRAAAARPRHRRWPVLAAVAAALLVTTGSLALPGGSSPFEGPSIPRIEERPSAGDLGGEQPAHLAPVRSDSADHGEEVSGTARTTEEAGKAKGEKVSEVATSKSSEHRQDVVHRPAENPAGKQPGPGAGGKPDQTPGNAPGGS